MSFFQRVGNAMARFMYGRNGGDRLGLVTIWTAIVIDVVCLFIKGQQVLYLILSTLSTAMVLWALWRMFSRNLAKRRAEDIDTVYDILVAGTAKAVETTNETLAQVRKAMRIDYFTDRSIVKEWETLLRKANQ